MWSVHHRKFEEKSCLWRESIIPFESANSTKENRRYHFFSTCRYATKTINISQWTHAGTCWKSKLFIAGKSNKCDRRLTESLKKNLEGRAFYCLNQQILPKRTWDIVFFFQKKDDYFDNMQIYPADHRQRYVNINERCYVYLWSCLFRAVSTGSVNEWAKSYILTEYVSEKEKINRLVVESSLVKVSQVLKYDSRRSWCLNLFSSGKASRKFLVNALPASNINS